ncbi:MAG: hypothetical protein EOP49_03295 [Sphingobacteriales bacterium]|nr:MAG: hypothetical protein EOP49_03295 [Sphingobacteriales bacterium]
MNINEVPQDPKDFKEGEKLKKLVYATDKDGKYTGVNSAGWDAENFAMKQAWDAADEELAETVEAIKRGELSPLAFYMKKSLMDLSLLAKYAGKWQWQVKRHMKPSVFKDLPQDLLQTYANIFNITVPELVNFGK